LFNNTNEGAVSASLNFTLGGVMRSNFKKVGNFTRVQIIKLRRERERKYIVYYLGEIFIKTTKRVSFCRKRVKHLKKLDEEGDRYIDSL